jgi:tight adherence protein B
MLPGLDSATGLALLSGAAAAASLGVVGLAVGAAADRRSAKRRLDAVRERARGVIVPLAGADAARSLSRQAAATGIDRVARRWLPRRHLLAARLARTGRQIGLGHYAIVCLAAVFLIFVAFAALAPIGLLPSLLLGLALGLGLPHLVIGRMGKRRVAAFIALFPDAIDLMVRALRSGLPISEAIVSAGQEIADPVGAELRLVESGMRVGRELEDLLWETASRIDTPDFRFFIIALSVQRETGGNLAETLGNLADVLRRRRQMAAKVRAMASETRATTMILGGLPIAVILLLWATSPGYLTPLFHDVRGYILDGLAVAMLVTGVAIMTKMANFEI